MWVFGTDGFVSIPATAAPTTVNAPGLICVLGDVDGWEYLLKGVGTFTTGKFVVEVNDNPADTQGWLVVEEIDVASVILTNKVYGKYVAGRPIGGHARIRCSVNIVGGGTIYAKLNGRRGSF